MHANKLHLNMKKSCLTHFKPKDPSFKKNLDQPEVPPIKINDFEIKEVDNTKFLGVTIDNEYSWIPRLTTLAKKLRCCTWAAKHLPASLHKNLYHTLFESHLSYGITVWGGISISKLKSVFTAQKHYICILFGDNEEYLEKHRTAARTRHIDNQKLGPEFFEKEHNKPLFINNEILTVHNLYNYHLLLGIGMILKSHTPIALYAMFKVSRRKPILIIVPTHYTLLRLNHLFLNQVFCGIPIKLYQGNKKFKEHEIIFPFLYTIPIFIIYKLLLRGPGGGGGGGGGVFIKILSKLTL